MIHLEVPVLTADGEPITGKVYAEIINFRDEPVDSMPLTWGGSLAYPAASFDNSSARLTMRRYRWQEGVERAAWPAIPGAVLPDSLYHPYRLDRGPRFKTEGIADHVPPRIGPRYVALVPQVDADGNEIAGIRLPEVAVPLATYTGWYLRDPEFSRTLRRNAGRSWPLPRTAQEREATGDPRPAILERYPTRADYLFKVSKIIMELRRQRLLLDEDVPRLLELALEQTFWNGSDDVSAEDHLHESQPVDHPPRWYRSPDRRGRR